MSSNWRVLDEEMDEFHNVVSSIAGQFGETIDFESVIKYLKNVESCKPPCFQTPHFFRWISLEVGGKSKEDLIREVENKGWVISRDVYPILQSINYTPSVRKIKLGKRKVSGIGFPEYPYPTEQEVRSRIIGHGHKLCTVETTLYLAVNYPLPEEVEVLEILSEPIILSEKAYNLALIGGYKERHRTIDILPVNLKDRTSTFNTVVFELNS
jgi:hypothetical protein